MSSSPALRLASASPRRRELLAQIGVPHAVEIADVDEDTRQGEAVMTYVERVARAKAETVWLRQRDLPVARRGHGRRSRWRQSSASRVIARMDWRCSKRSAGREHRVLTAVALVSVTGTRCIISESIVRMRASTPQERDRYWDTGEPRDKAGGYAIQGLGAIFIQSLQGSYSGVMGLPLFETAQLLTAAQVPCWSGA